MGDTLISVYLDYIRKSPDTLFGIAMPLQT